MPLFVKALAAGIALTAALILSIPSDQAQTQDTGQTQSASETVESAKKTITTLDEWFDLLDENRDTLQSEWVRQRATHDTVRLYDDDHRPYYLVIVTDMTNPECANLVDRQDDGTNNYCRSTKFYLHTPTSVEDDIIIMPMEERADGGTVVMTERDLVTLVYVLSPAETAAVDTNQRMVEMGVWPAVPVTAEN